MHKIAVNNFYQQTYHFNVNKKLLFIRRFLFTSEKKHAKNKKSQKYKYVYKHFCLKSF